jgi:hypothetical protein
MRVLPAYPPFDACSHEAGIGLDETQRVTIVPEEQIEVRGLTRPIIHRGEGAGTIRVDSIGTGVSNVLRDGAVNAERVDAGQRAVTIKTILASEDERHLLAVHNLKAAIGEQIGPLQRGVTTPHVGESVVGISQVQTDIPESQQAQTAEHLAADGSHHGLPSWDKDSTVERQKNLAGG